MASKPAFVIETLQKNASDLQRLGVLHAAVFGSVARGDTTGDSDIDLLIDLDATRRLGLYAYVRIKL